MIRITMIKDGGIGRAPILVVKEFEDGAAASNWLVCDSYFDSHNVRKVVWERVTS